MVLWTKCSPSNFTCCCPLLGLAMWRWDAVGKGRKSVWVEESLGGFYNIMHVFIRKHAHKHAHRPYEGSQEESPHQKQKQLDPWFWTLYGLIVCGTQRTPWVNVYYCHEHSHGKDPSASASWILVCIHQSTHPSYSQFVCTCICLLHFLGGPFRSTPKLCKSQQMWNPLRLMYLDIWISVGDVVLVIVRAFM